MSIACVFKCLCICALPDSLDKERKGMVLAAECVGEDRPVNAVCREKTLNLAEAWNTGKARSTGMGM